MVSDNYTRFYRTRETFELVQALVDRYVDQEPDSLEEQLAILTLMREVIDACGNRIASDPGIDMKDAMRRKCFIADEITDEPGVK